MSVAVPLFTYAASVNHKGDHTIKETTLGDQATETPYNATAVPFTEADLVRVGELRCDKMRTREGGPAVPGRVKTQRLTVTNGSWDGTGHTTNTITHNPDADGEGNSALYVHTGGANVVGGLRVNGTVTVVSGHLRVALHPFFCAAMIADFTPASGRILGVWQNSANSGAWDGSTGLFTSPVTGYYRFTFTGIADWIGGVRTTVQLYVNGSAHANPLISAHTDGDPDAPQKYRHIGFNAIVYMVAGWTANLHLAIGKLYGSSKGYTFFTGELVQAT
eukprot:tig00021036_g17384.t1